MGRWWAGWENQSSGELITATRYDPNKGWRRPQRQGDKRPRVATGGHKRQRKASRLYMTPAPFGRLAGPAANAGGDLVYPR